MRKEKVACYIRVSSQEQKIHGYSISAQRDRLTQYAEEHELIIHDWYCDEGVSGRKPIAKRPELQRMLVDAEAHLFDRIIFIKLDRFFRSVGEYYEAMKRIGKVTWTATEEPYDLSTASGRNFVNMKLAIAELEADQTGERIRMVNEYKVKTGQPLSGSVAFGFTVVGERGSKRVVKDPAAQEQAEWIIEHLLLNRSIRKCSLEFTEHFGYFRDDTSIRNFAKNTMLYGCYRGNPNYCEPYMSKTEWDRLQSIVSHPCWNGNKRTYYFTGLITCPGCGRKLIGFPCRSLSGSRKVVSYYKRYHCRLQIQNHQCTFKKSYSENVLERTLLEMLPGELDRIRDMHVKSSDMPKVNKADIKAKIDRLNYAWENGRISVNEYDEKYKKLADMLNFSATVADFSEVEHVLSGDWVSKYQSLSDKSKQLFWRNLLKEIRLGTDGSVLGVVFNLDI